MQIEQVVLKDTGDQLFRFTELLIECRAMQRENGPLVRSRSRTEKAEAVPQSLWLGKVVCKFIVCKGMPIDRNDIPVQARHFLAIVLIELVKPLIAVRKGLPGANPAGPIRIDEHRICIEWNETTHICQSSLRERL